MVTNNRIEWIDSLKGFAIFLVVMGHLIQMRWWPDGEIIKEYIYSFHMPLFMLISGFFARKGTELISLQEIRMYIRRKAFQLLIPFTIFGFFFLIVHRLTNIWKDYILLGGREYWFLWVLFQFFVWVTLCSFLYNKLVKKYQIPSWGIWIWLLIPLSVMQQSSGIFTSILSQNNFIHNYPFFISGIALSRYSVLMKVAINKRIGVVSLCGYLLLMSLSPFPGIEYLRAICVIQLLISVFQSSIHFRPLKTVGYYSLEIYLMHYYLCYLIPYSTFNSLKNIYNNLNIHIYRGGYITDIQIITPIILYFTLICAICIFTAKMAQKNSLIRKYCFGK